MGSTSFHASGTGVSARVVFDELVRSAQAAHAARGRRAGPHCSNIGDKPDFVMIPLPDDVHPDDRRAAADAADMLIDQQDEQIDDKYGPAGCFELDAGADPQNPSHGFFLFFGWAPE